MMYFRIQLLNSPKLIIITKTYLPLPVVKTLDTPLLWVDLRSEENKNHDDRLLYLTDLYIVIIVFLLPFGRSFARYAVSVWNR